MEREAVLALKSGESSFLSSDRTETEGEGGITLKCRLELSSGGMSSVVGTALSVVGGRSRAEVIRI